MLRRWVRHRKFDRNLHGQIYTVIRVIPFAFGGVIMSGNVAVADGSYNFSMFGVNGGVSHAPGQSDIPVRLAILEGKGKFMLAPSLGYVNEVCSVGASSRAMT